MNYLEKKVVLDKVANLDKNAFFVESFDGSKHHPLKIVWILSTHTPTYKMSTLRSRHWNGKI